MNTLEFLVHHEDVRRAQPGWAPRVLGDAAERDAVVGAGRTPGKALTRRAPVGVVAESRTRRPAGPARVLRRRCTVAPSVTVRGLPSEVALFLFGRSEHARVELLGDDDAVARLRATSLGA